MMKTLHKTAAVALALGMMFSSVPMNASAAGTVAVAAGDLSQEQVVEKAKQLVDLPKGFVLRNASYAEKGSDSNANRSIWQVVFGSENLRTSSYIGVTLDAKTGQLLGYDFSQPDTTKFDKSISREDAHKVALEYAKKWAGDKLGSMKEIEIDPTSEYGQYNVSNKVETFRWVRLVDGIPFAMDGVNVRIGADGILRGFSFSWNEELKFPKATSVITPEKATEAFVQSLNLNLQYNREIKPFSREVNYQLVYSLLDHNNSGQLPQIDATQGVEIGFDGKTVAKKPKIEWKPLTEKAAPAPAKELSKDDALNLLKNLGVVSSDFKVENVSFDSFNESKSWHFELGQGDPKSKEYKHISTSVDAQTGELVSFYSYSGTSTTFPEKPALTADQARAKAIELVKKAMSTRTDKIAVIPTPTTDEFRKGPGYQFTFVSLVNGLPLNNSNTRITIDPNTGSLVDMFMDRPSTNVKNISKPADAFSLKEAQAKFVEKFGLELQYVPVYENQSTAYSKGPQAVALVYAPKAGSNTMNLDAVTGKWTMPWGGQPIEYAPVEDIKGHWAEKQLQFFAERGIFEVKEGKLSPDSFVTRGDMIRYMLLSLNGPRLKSEFASYADVAKSSTNYEFIEEAVIRQWLDTTDKNFRPDDAITRAELSELITTALGYKKLSETENTFKANFSDVSPTANKRYFGDIAVVSSLGILTGADGKFNPDQKVTKAQAAVVLTRVLDQYKDNIINYNHK